MSSLIHAMVNDKLIKPPSCVGDRLQYETYVGSRAAGVNQPGSDADIYGFCIPDIRDIFPHLRGEIPGFGKPLPRFEQYQQQVETGAGRVDVTVYSIVRFFHLATDNNPNILSSLYTPEDCVIYSSRVGAMVRSNRDVFPSRRNVTLHYLGAVQSSLKRMTSASPESKRYPVIQQYGYDTKEAYSAARLLDEADQLLAYGTIADFRRIQPILLEIRRGEWSHAQVESYLNEKIRRVNALSESGSLRFHTDWHLVKSFLLECLEEYFGSVKMSEVSDVSPAQKRALERILEIAQEALYKNK
jgi:uncharacterized protein